MANKYIVMVDLDVKSRAPDTLKILGDCSEHYPKRLVKLACINMCNIISCC